MKLVYLSPTSLLFLGKSSSTSGIGKALINCKRRMGGESPSNDNNPFYDTSFKTHQDAAHAFLFSLLLPRRRSLFHLKNSLTSKKASQIYQSAFDLGNDY